MIYVVLREGGAGGPCSEGALAESMEAVNSIVSVKRIESRAVERACALRQRAVCLYTKRLAKKMAATGKSSMIIT